MLELRAVHTSVQEMHEPLLPMKSKVEEAEQASASRNKCSFQFEKEKKNELFSSLRSLHLFHSAS
jgi:hypothetical protein